MHVSRSKVLTVFFLSFVPLLGLMLAPRVHASIIDPASITEVNPSGYGTFVQWDDSRDIGDLYWNDRTELIGAQGKITDAMTGKTMLGLEGLLLNNGAKNTKGNGPGEDYELKFNISSGLSGKARVYVLLGIRDVFQVDPDDWVQNRLNDNSYSPQSDVSRFQADRTWIGLDVYGVPIGPVFNRILRRPSPDGRPMAFPCRDGVGEEYFAFYHDFNPGEAVGIYGCYSGGSNYYVFAEMTPPTPSIWTSTDIGATIAGDAFYNDATATWDLYGDGADIWDTADAFHYLYTENSGDFTIQARFNSLQNVENDWGKLGLMVRQSTDAGSPHTTFATRAANDYLAFQFRDSQGGGSGGSTEWWPGGGQIPRWFRLQRTGNTFSSYLSDDGVNWTAHGTRDHALTDPVLVGVSLTSHVGNRLTSAQIRNLYVTGKGQVFAHAGFDQSVDQGAADSFVLDGSGCLGDNLEFLWEQLTGAPNVIPDPAAQSQTIDTTTINIFGDQTFTFRLTVKDTVSGATQTATIHVFVKDKEQANAGPDQNVAEGVQVTLDGSGTTGVITTWDWDQVAGPDVSPIFGEDTAHPFFFVSNYTNDQVIQFKLTINGGEDVDYVNINVTDAEKAVANAGADQEGYEMRGFQLDGTGCTTRNGEPYTSMTYQWQQTGGPAVYKFEGTNTATPTFIAPEIPVQIRGRYVWPPWRDLTFSVTATAPNASTASDTVTVTIKDHEFETVFYREHEDYDFHNSLVNGKWYPEEAAFGVRYCQGLDGERVSGTFGRLKPDVDYWWNDVPNGDSSYRDGGQCALGNDASVAATCGTEWKSGWINPGAGDYWKYTFDLPHGSTKAYVVHWLSSGDGNHGNSHAFYDYEQGNTSPIGTFRVQQRGWDNFTPYLSPPFAVGAGLHRIMLDAFGAGQPNYARFELHVPMPQKNVANAGPDKGALSGEVVTLNGSGSQGVGLSYTWEQLSPDTPQVTLTDAGFGVATFTAPAAADVLNFVFRLTVSGAGNDSSDMVQVTVVPAGVGFSLFAEQRTARDLTTTNWGSRDTEVGGAEMGPAFETNSDGALPPDYSLSSEVVAAGNRLTPNVVVHYNQQTTGAQNNDCYSEFTFNNPTGAGDYYFYLRGAYQNGDSAVIRCNDGVAGFWPTANPEEDAHHVIANDNGYRGEYRYNWTTVNADTVTLIDGVNQVRIYGRESHVGGWLPFVWDAMIFSKVALPRTDLDLMDAVARAGQTAATVKAHAGADFSVLAGATAVLDGTGSSGAITTYQWTQTAGPGVTINNATQAVATFVAPAVSVPTNTTFQLTVSDGTNSNSDTVNVQILKAGPPPAPTNLAAEGIPMGIQITWDAAPGALSYKILRREVGVPWPFDVLVVEGLGGTSFVDTSMPIFMDMTYSYTVIAVNSFGESSPALPAQDYALSANLALRADAGPFAKKPHPGWTLGLLMNNQVKEESFDSWYYSQASADDWWGYMYPQPMYFQEIHYYPGNVFVDGGYWTSLGVQFTKDGEFWYDIPNVTIDPPYDFRDNLPEGERSPAFGQLPYVRKHVLRFPKVEGIGVRIYGSPGGTLDFTSMAELELYGVPGPEGYLYSYAGADFSADEGTVATLDGRDSSTPLAVAYQWEQLIGGPVTQVDMTSAFNADVIWAKGEDLASQDPFEPSASRYVFTSNPDVGPYVLPVGGRVGGMQLGPYIGNNCLLLSDQQTSGTVPVPAGNYGSLEVAFAGASGNHVVNLSLNYSAGASDVTSFEFSDWFFRGDVDRLVEETYRVNSTNGSAGRNDSTPVGGPNIYRRSIPVNPNRTLVSVTFSGFAGSGTETGGVFAMNLGPPVQQVVQLDLSSVFNKDVIWAQGEDLPSQDAFDPGGPWVYTSNPDVGAEVLPATGQVGGYQFGPYTDNNCLLLSESQTWAVVPVVPGNYGYVGVAYAAANGSPWCNVVLNYANGDSPTIPFQIYDWFFNDVPRLVEETWRVRTSDGATDRNDGTPVGGPNIYLGIIPVDPNRTLQSVTFRDFTGTGNTTGGVFAMNLGPPMPVVTLQNPNSAVCTFNVPEITQDQVITFRLTVWDASGNSATDDVDVTLVDAQASKANAGADATVKPYTSYVLDGSGTGGDIISYKWQQIGGPRPVALFNADQAQATIIVPDAGATMTFKLTTVSANGTVSSDTVTVTSQYPLNPDPYNIVYEPAVLATLPSVPSSGYIQDVLLLGANYTSRFTSYMDADERVLDHDHLAANGGQANQVPIAGQTVNIGGESFADGPAVWTPMHTDDGWWFHDMADNYVGYFHVYIISPDQRDARAILRHDDAMACWDNGALSFNRTGWDGGGEVTSDFTLFAGVNCMTFKLREGGGGDELAVRFADRNNNQYSDLRYVLSYDQLPPAPVAMAEPDAYEGITVAAGEVLYLDARTSQSLGTTFSWEQVYPQTPEFAFWFGDSNIPILGAPMVAEDTVFYIRLWVDDGTNKNADVVKVTVATREVPGAVSNVTGEWAGDVGAVLRWDAAAHASRYIIQRAEDPAGPYLMVGTAEDAVKFVDTGPLDPDATYYYEIVPASILNVGPTFGPIAISRNPNLGNVALSNKAVPIVGQPNPLGGGSRDIGLMKDGIVSGQNYDTYDGNTPNPGSLPGEETFEFFGYLFDSPIEIHSLVYYTGGVFGNGGWWTTFGVQVTRDDGVTWQDAPSFVSGPVYDTTDSGSGRSAYTKYIISITPDTVDGVRIAGHAGGSARFVSIAELGAYGDIGGLSVSAGADSTVDEGTIVTLDGSATTGATTIEWTQLSGPSVVINNADQLEASFTAPGVFFSDTLSFRLTASNPQWESFDEVSVTVQDVDSYHIYRYAADFDGRGATGRLEFPAGEWGTGIGFQHDLVQRMLGKPANRAATPDAVAGNEFYFQATAPTQTYRAASVNPFDVQFRDFGNGANEPYVGSTTPADWWNFTFGVVSKTEDTSFPVDGVMAVSVLASAPGAVVLEAYNATNQLLTTISFTGTGLDNYQWRASGGTFLASAGGATIRLRVASGSPNLAKVRLDLTQPQIESITPFDGWVILKWNDVRRTYMVQGAATPAGPWVDVYGPTTETSLTAPIPAEKLGFYRIEVQ
jgi:hypothetical protein